MARRATKKPAKGDSRGNSRGRMPADLPPELPTVARNFRVAIDGVEIGFATISQLASTSVEEQARGRTKLVHRYANIVLRRALGRDKRLHAWREAIMAGRKDRRRVEICQLDDNGEAVLSTWVLEGAWPCRWAGPVFDALGIDVAMEDIELSFDRLIWR